MGSVEGTFRTAVVGGFNRQDVLNYIEARAREHRERCAALQKTVDEERRRREEAETGASAGRERIGELEDKLSAAEKQAAGETAAAAGLIRAAGRPVSVLNLFAYTGGATVACAAAGASVCHVDAARGMVNWARENARLSGLEDAPIRWIVDDCGKFVEREIRRGRRYDAVIMDPPSYGRGPSGEVWKLEENLWPFVELAAKVLSPQPLFFLINSYTTGLAPSVLTYILESVVTRQHGGHTVSGELGIPVSHTGLALPAGSTGRWVSDR